MGILFIQQVEYGGSHAIWYLMLNYKTQCSFYTVLLECLSLELKPQRGSSNGQADIQGDGHPELLGMWELPASNSATLISSTSNSVPDWSLTPLSVVINSSNTKVALKH